jgi:hypothetical protein
MKRILFDIYVNRKSFSYTLNNAGPEDQAFCYALAKMPPLYGKFIVGRMLSCLEGCEVIRKVDLTLVEPLRVEVLGILGENGVSGETALLVWLVMNRVFSRLWNGARKLIEGQVALLSRNTEGSLFANRFIITTLIRQLSKSLHNALDEYLQGQMLTSLDPQLSGELVRFIIENHELFAMEFHTIEETEDPEVFAKNLMAIWEVARHAKDWRVRLEMAFECEARELRSIGVHYGQDFGFLIQHPEQDM